MEEKRKSDRKTLFLSFLDGTEEEAHQLHKIMDDAGITEDYRVIATTKPVQILNEDEMAEMIKIWTGDDIGTRDRINKIRHSLHFIEESLKALKSQAMTTNENFMQVETSFNQLQTSLISALANVQGSNIPNAYFHRLISSAEHQLTQAVQNLESYTPKEGAEW